MNGRFLWSALLAPAPHRAATDRGGSDQASRRALKAVPLRRVSETPARVPPNGGVAKRRRTATARHHSDPSVVRFTPRGKTPMKNPELVRLLLVRCGLTLARLNSVWGDPLALPGATSLQAKVQFATPRERDPRAARPSGGDAPVSYDANGRPEARQARGALDAGRDVAARGRRGSSRPVCAPTCAAHAERGWRETALPRLTLSFRRGHLLCRVGLGAQTPTGARYAVMWSDPGRWQRSVSSNGEWRRRDR